MSDTGMEKRPSHHAESVLNAMRKAIKDVPKELREATMKHVLNHLKMAAK